MQGDRLRIAYVGNFQPRHSTENHIRLSLESMGHTVVRLQENQVGCGAILEAARRCDLLLYTRTWGFLEGPKAGRILLAQLAELGVPTASYHLDLYFGLKRQRTIESDPFWMTKYVFTPDGGHDAELRRAGINHHYLRPGVFGPECVPGTPRADFAHDVVFVGSYAGYHAEWPYRRELVDWLRATYGDRFAHYGDGRVVRNEALNDLYASAKIVVGDSLCLGFTHPHYWSDRVYETVGRGGFLIHPHITGMEQEFQSGAHLVYYRFGDFAQLRALIDHYLVREEERRAIAARGQAFVREHCTYAHRLAEALAIIREGEASPGRRPAPRPPARPRKLEIGSGYFPHPDFDVHLDANPNCPHLEHPRRLEPEGRQGPRPKLADPRHAARRVGSPDAVLAARSQRGAAPARPTRVRRRCLRPGLGSGGRTRSASSGWRRSGRGCRTCVSTAVSPTPSCDSSRTRAASTSARAPTRASATRSTRASRLAPVSW